MQAVIDLRQLVCDSRWKSTIKLRIICLLIKILLLSKRERERESEREIITTRSICVSHKQGNVALKSWNFLKPSVNNSHVHHGVPSAANLSWQFYVWQKIQFHEKVNLYLLC